MGNLTDDMSRLCGEIVSLRDARGALIIELARGARELTNAVSSMQADFCDVRTKMAKKTKTERAAFVSGVKKKVMNMRKEISGDLAGARRAWSGPTESELFQKCRQIEAEARRKEKERKRTEEKCRRIEAETGKKDDDWWKSIEETAKRQEDELKAKEKNRKKNLKARAQGPTKEVKRTPKGKR